MQKNNKVNEEGLLIWYKWIITRNKYSINNNKNRYNSAEIMVCVYEMETLKAMKKVKHICSSS